MLSDFDPIVGKPHTGISLSDLARLFSLDLIGPDAEVLYQGSLTFRREKARCNVLTYLTGEEFLPEFETKRFDFAIIPEKMRGSRLPENRSYLITKGNPLDVFIGIHLYVVENRLYHQVEEGVGKNCEISRKASIHPNVMIGDHCKIDDYVVLYPNTIIGNHVRIKAGTVIGGDGFEIKTIYGRRRIIPHCGGTILEDNVEVGSCCSIDRSMRHAFTFIGAGTKLSNQVQIAHGAYLAQDCIVAGHGQIANVRLGRGVFIGAAVSCKPQITLGDYVFVGMGSVVLDSAPDHALLYGNPAQQKGWVCRCRSRMDIHAKDKAICPNCGLKYVKDGDRIICLDY
jgi:UDP-3-O-[3-hydroxymyristoyl] glucosamine N-acyltransferase